MESTRIDVGNIKQIGRRDYLFILQRHTWGYTLVCYDVQQSVRLITFLFCNCLFGDQLLFFPLHILIAHWLGLGLGSNRVTANRLPCFLPSSFTVSASGFQTKSPHKALKNKTTK